MTRTDRILAAVHRELENRRPELDRDEGVRVVVLKVRLNRRTGCPYAVRYELETERPIDSRAGCVLT